VSVAGRARPPVMTEVLRASTEQMESSSQLVLKVSFDGVTKRRGGCYVPTKPQRLRALLTEILATEILATQLIQWIDPDGDKVDLVNPGDIRDAVASAACVRCVRS
jgi:hypothetical protein